MTYHKLCIPAFAAKSSFIAILLSTVSPAAAQDTVSINELKALKSQAESARKNAEEALKIAQDAERDINKALNDRLNPNPPEISYELARLDCYHGKPNKGSKCSAETENLKGDLTFYANFKEIKNNEIKETNYNKSAENLLQNHINKGRKSEKLSFSRKDLPLTSRISTSTGEKAIGLDYAIPLSRKRILSANREDITPMNDTLTVGVTAAFDGDNKKAGLIARAGKFNDSPITASVSWSRAYHKKLPLHVDPKDEKKESFASRGMNLTDKLISLCKATLASPAPVFADPPSKPIACEGDQLLEWAFSPDTPSFKDNVAAYNKAFWEPSDDSIPRYGLGIKATVGTQNFKYIPPSVFAPQGYVPNKNPIFVSTLNTDDLTTPNLGQQVQREWSFEGTAFIFGHIPIKNSIFEGFTVRPSVTLAKRWEVDSDFADKQFCRITVSPVTECKTFNIAAPEAYEAIEPSFNFRTKLSFAKGNAWTRRYVPSIGLSPTISYSSHESRTRVAVPAFLAVDKDGKFSGGVQYAREWGNIDKNKNVTVWSIFVGTNFSLDGSQE